MPNRVPWTSRTFRFDEPADLFPELIARLAGAPARLEELARDRTDDQLRARTDDTWSIQENIGHLADLEALFTGRLDDYDAGAPELRPADMTNRATHDADHNASAIDDVLADFRAKRAALVTRLDALPPEAFARTAHHPRLGTPMRTVDMLRFQAEHDDYHIARIRQLIAMHGGH